MNTRVSALAPSRWRKSAAGGGTGLGLHAALCGRVGFELLSNPHMSVSYFVGNGKALLIGANLCPTPPRHVAQRSGADHPAASAPYSRALSLTSKPQFLLIQHHHLLAGLNGPADQRKITGTSPAQHCCQMVGGKTVSCWVCSLLAMSPQISGVLSFHAYKGLLLGSRRKTDEMVKEWGCNAGFGLTLAFADYQPGPSPL